MQQSLEYNGTHRPFCGTSFTARHWLSLDPCGLLCATLVWMLHVFSWGILWDSMIGSFVPAQVLFYGCYSPIMLLAFYCHYQTWSTDPGSVPFGAKPYEGNLRDNNENSKMENQPKHRVTSESGESLLTSSSEDESRSSIGSRPNSHLGVLTYAQRFPRGVRRCKKCHGNFKPARAHHDSVTGRCIVKLDHFCPWVGNAVGIRNHKIFLLFIFYTFLTTIFGAILIIMRFAHCGFSFDDDDDDFYHTDDDGADMRSDFHRIYETQERIQRFLDAVYPGCDDGDDNPLIFQGEVLTVIILTFCAFLFTLIMMFDQYEAVTLSISKIARMKISANDERSEAGELDRVMHDFNEVFGGSSDKFAWHWLVPKLVVFPEDKIDLLMGYEIDNDAYERNEPWRYEKESRHTRRIMKTSSKSTHSDSFLFSNIHQQIGDQLRQTNASQQEKDFCEDERERLLNNLENDIKRRTASNPSTPGLGNIDDL